jgi:hypothetical protein
VLEYVRQTFLGANSLCTNSSNKAVSTLHFDARFIQHGPYASSRLPSSPSPDEEANTIKTQYSCYEYVQIKTINGSDHSQKVVILFTMQIGLEDLNFPFSVDEEPFVSLPRHTNIRINQQVLGEEIVCRCNKYDMDIVKPAQWKKEKQITRLKKNPIPSNATDDLEFIKTSLEQITMFAKQLVDNVKAHGVSMIAMCKNWSNYMSWLQLGSVSNWEGMATE